MDGLICQQCGCLNDFQKEICWFCKELIIKEELMSQETLKKYGLFYKDEQILVHSNRTNVVMIPCGSMVETVEGFEIVVDKDLPKDSRVIVKPVPEDKGQPTGGQYDT